MSLYTLRSEIASSKGAHMFSFRRYKQVLKVVIPIYSLVSSV